MQKNILIIFLLVMVICLGGCQKAQPPKQETQESLSMEALSSLSPETTPSLPESEEPQAPLTEPYKPTIQEIQTALKNAGFYAGAIDGKIGPLSKKATEEFQKANGLEADGKVGPKTWAVLSAYLNPQVPTVSSTKRQ